MYNYHGTANLFNKQMKKIIVKEREKMRRLIKQIFIDNSIIHFIDTDKNIPTDVYTIYARYKTETKTINKKHPL